MIWEYDLLLVMYALPPRETMATSRQAEVKNDHKRQGVFRPFNQQRATLQHEHEVKRVNR